ncbi:hypothetical protein EWM64_g9677 [Hericium alpestre]|uniref:Uncharacterized protein n=1 Tax=Hericium alpestre TaxID=135208 RepID=A0A4Y9ZIR1_9AGAM|nr:hypothetical protein EWM64_g9677 [Hericium alpestre]
MYNKTAGKIAKIVEKMLMRTLQGITHRSQTEWYHISVTDGGVALKRVIVLFSSYNFRSEEDIGTFVSLARRILEPVIVIPTEELLRVEDSYGPTLESVPFPDCLLPAPPQHNERITIGPIFTNADCLDIIKAMNRVSSTGQTRMHFDTIPHGVVWGGWREKASEVLKEKVVAEFSDN